MAVVPTSSIRLNTDLQISNTAIFSVPTLSVDVNSSTADDSLTTSLASDTGSTSAPGSPESSSTTSLTISISPLNSTTSLPATTIGSINASPAASSTTPIIEMDDSSKVNGLIAGIVIFAALFLAVTGVLIWTIWKKRKDRHAIIIDQAFPTVAKQSSEHSVTGLEHTIASLETQLHEKDVLLREQKVDALSKGRPPITRAHTIDRVSLSDGQIRARFATLQQAIHDWVSTYFVDAKFTTKPRPEILATVRKSFPRYEELSKERELVPIILEGLVASTLCQAFASGQLLGNEAFWELKQAIFAKASAAQANEWRAITSHLLDKIPSYQDDRTEAVEDISQMIDTSCSELTKTRPKDERRASLERLVDTAASLALDMAKQKALYKVEKPDSTIFEAETMIPSKAGSEEDPTGKPVRAVIYPMITKWGGEPMKVWDTSQVVVKAKVLL